MNIYVLMKRTFDTEEEVFVENDQVIDDDSQFIINPYDEYAIEEAVDLKEIHGGEVTVLSVGCADSEEQLREGLAMGADKAVLIELEPCMKIYDDESISKIIASYLEDKDYDLIMAGNVAIDIASGQVGPRVAEMLSIPCITTITEIEIKDKLAKIMRDVEGDYEKLEIGLPIVATAQQGLNDPRYPTLPGIMRAKRIEIDKLSIEDLGLSDKEIQAKTKSVSLQLPESRTKGEILQGEMENQVKELVSLLKDDLKVINIS